MISNSFYTEILLAQMPLEKKMDQMNLKTRVTALCGKVI